MGLYALFVHLQSKQGYDTEDAERDKSDDNASPPPPHPSKKTHMIRNSSSGSLSTNMLALGNGGFP